MKNKQGLVQLALGVLLLVSAYIAMIHFANVTTPFVVVEGRSMIPTLYNGDMVLVYKPGPQEIKPGMIIVYRSLEGRLVIHRVVEVNQCGTQYCYITKGDNNVIPDNEMYPPLQPPYGVAYRDVIGVVVSVNINGRYTPLRIPYLGLLSLIVKR